MAETRSEVKIVRSEIIGPSLRRAAIFCRLQRWFDHARNARCNVVLEVKDIANRAVEVFGPEMSVSGCVKQLRGNADTISSLANRALQHIQNPKFSADLFHVHCSTLVGEARIAGDHKEPADARQCGNDLFD